MLFKFIANLSFSVHEKETKTQIQFLIYFIIIFFEWKPPWVRTIYQKKKKKRLHRSFCIVVPIEMKKGKKVKLNLKQVFPFQKKESKEINRFLSQ